MTCPMYKDYTRECVTSYESAIKVFSFDICDSDNYNECPLYNIITNKVEYCEYTHKCDEEMNFGSLDFEHIKDIATNFCFYGNKKKCAIYKLRKAGKKVPKGLQSDGKIIELKN